MKDHIMQTRREALQTLGTAGAALVTLNGETLAKLGNNTTPVKMPLLSIGVLPMDLHSLRKNMLGWRIIQDKEYKIQLIVFFKEECDHQICRMMPLQAGYFYRWTILGEDAARRSLKTLDEAKIYPIDVEVYVQMVATGPDGAWVEANMENQFVLSFGEGGTAKMTYGSQHTPNSRIISKSSLNQITVK